MKIGFMGVGYMGHGAARNILAKGYALKVLGNRNRSPVDDLVTRGATEASSPADLAASCDIVFTCLPSSTQVEQAVLGQDGFVQTARPGFILVDCTTADPLSTRKLGATLASWVASKPAFNACCPSFAALPTLSSKPARWARHIPSN
jgi:3-hydroxyisobutyrate dehydrogenase-like beta-hydroxyacid dehydrogenase